MHGRLELEQWCASLEFSLRLVRRGPRREICIFPVRYHIHKDTYLSVPPHTKSACPSVRAFVWQVRGECEAVASVAEASAASRGFSKRSRERARLALCEAQVPRPVASQEPRTQPLVKELSKALERRRATESESSALRDR